MRSQGVRLLAALSMLLTASTPAAAQQSRDPDRIVYDVVYLSVDGVELTLDLYLKDEARAESAPVFVFVHGGGWAGGRLSNGWAGFRPYIEAGFSVVTVEYRLAGEALAPAAVRDVRCALVYIRDNAAELGVDPDRIALGGASAGGHLALLAGAMNAEPGFDLPGCENPPRPAAIVDFFAPTDLAVAVSADGSLHPTVRRWVGSGAGARDLARRMSPVTHVSSDDPPTLIIHGDADRVVPIQQSYALVERLDAAGVPHRLVVVEGGGHGRFPEVDNERVFEAVFAFLREQGVSN